MKCKFLFTVFLFVGFFVSGYTFAGDLELIIDVDSVDCFGSNSGRISVMVNSGTPNYTFILFDEAPWKGGEELSRSEPVNTNYYVFENLKAGKYNIAVEDINKNGNIVTVFIDEPGKLMLNDSKEIVNDQIKLKAVAQGGNHPYSYIWEFDSDTVHSDEIILSSEGAYKCSVSDRNNCGPVSITYFHYNGFIERTIHNILGR